MRELICTQYCIVFTNMKSVKPLIIIALIIALVACKKNDQTHQQNKITKSFFESDSLTIHQEPHELKAFRTFANSLDKSSALSGKLAIEAFISRFSNQSTGLADTAYLVLKQVLDTIEQEINTALLTDTTNYLMQTPAGKVSPALQKLEASLVGTGFKTLESEGFIYVVQHYSFIFQQVKNTVSNTMSEYLTQIVKENNEGFSVDAAITIQPSQHIERIVWYEQFIARNPEFVLISNCKAYKKAYLTYLFSGMDNTKLFSDLSAMRLNSYFQQAYKLVLQKYPHSECASLVKPLLHAIEQKNMNALNELLKNYSIKGFIFSQKPQFE